MGIYSEEGNFPDGRTLAGGDKSRSRLAVKALQGFQQLETESQGFSYNRPFMGPLTIDLFAARMNTQLQNYVS